MPLTLRARTLLKWNSHLGSTYRASSRRRKALGWHLWGYAYSLACLIFFDRMVLSSCSLSCSNRVITSPKKEGDKDTCNLNGPHSTVADLCGCLNKLKSHEKQKPLLERLHLEFCDTLPFHEHLAFLANATQCSGKLLRVVNADCIASQSNSKFKEIIGRIDCDEEYSVRWKCKHCKVGMKRGFCVILSVIVTSVSDNRLKSRFSTISLATLHERIDVAPRLLGCSTHIS
jgi:hypothetical protein